MTNAAYLEQAMENRPGNVYVVVNGRGCVLGVYTSARLADMIWRASGQVFTVQKWQVEA